MKYLTSYKALALLAILLAVSIFLIINFSQKPSDNNIIDKDMISAEG